MRDDNLQQPYDGDESTEGHYATGGTPAAPAQGGPTADALFDAVRTVDMLEDSLFKLMESLTIKDNWSDWSYDPYDSSLELYAVPVDVRLTDDDCTKIKEFGFSLCWLNHIDGWETLYSLERGQSYRTDRKEVKKVTDFAHKDLRRKLAALDSAAHPPVVQGLEEIASRTYLEKFTCKDDPDVIGAAIVSYGIDVLTNYVRQSQHKEPPCSNSVASVPSSSTAASESSVRNAVRDLIMGSDDDELLVESVTQFAINYARQFQERVARLDERIMQYENDEASVCPEDVGFVEFIGVLQKRVAELERDLVIKDCSQCHGQVNIIDSESGGFPAKCHCWQVRCNELRARAEATEAALRAACDELDRLIAKYVCWNSACKDESHVQIKAKAAELRGSK